ncbi:glycoside hydrolase family 2 TIM barrel-domain containing protein [Sphingobacterium sp. JB170]|uniref:glycoside hydrolase family 2 TIM barrel-domain containing protein n=1 Tax=Sphingobacterium sp. JB170 TaxID=1434842 RepID=UPI00097E76C3|nr:glycoside hydrolase family 2 TIM barrel-domain containing protein [Sphingobacterium sp. JB170]SJN43429.1 Beta-galactosidase [Sphingobacterium sp. JB170]
MIHEIAKVISRCFLLIALPIFVVAQTSPLVKSLSGFHFEQLAAPTGTEWESPENLSLNKELPHAYHFSFDELASALRVLPEHSTNWRSLNGEWKFHWAGTPEARPVLFYEPQYDVSSWDKVAVPMSWNIAGLQKNGSLKYGVPIYVNQQVIFKHQVEVDDWRGGVMRTPPEKWTTFKDRNEVGSFRRSFAVPKGWDGKEIYINFDGVDSFFYLWINGKYVGFSKNSRNLAAFNISKYLNPKGENIVAVEVYRNSDGSFLEAQDMFRLPGIFRTVSLTAKPKVQIRNLVAVPKLDDNYQNATLKITTEIKNFQSKVADGYKLRYNLQANELYSDNQVAGGEVNSAAVVAAVAQSGEVEHILQVTNPKKWSAELPYRYTLAVELLDKKGKVVEVVSTFVGFREVEIKDTKAQDDEFGLAGRYFYINGKTVKLKGVNRHETNPETGKVISRQQMEQEIILMKQANINHVRNSHYPDDPYWYYLCDKYGIYLEDEANIESHEYYYGEASLSHPKEWENAHVARNVEMVSATINHPSIVIWSLGNEAGPGDNFITAYNAIKKMDVSRPVQYERNNSIVDIGSNQYPSIDWVRGAVKGKYKLKYPFHISEYAHSMGNAAGNLVDYWEAIESTNFFMGGAIWDWIDQSMYAYDKKTGERFLAYGGDFGDKPNDGTFVMNGLLFADLTPKPQYYEVRKVYQNVSVQPLDIKNGEIEIFNKNYFTSLDQYEIEWSLWRDGKKFLDGDLAPEQSIGPRQKQRVRVPFASKKLRNESEYFLKIQFRQKEDLFWMKKGQVQMEEQLLIKQGSKPSITQNVKAKALVNTVDGSFQVIHGEGFKVQFDNKTGTIYQLSYDDKVVFAKGQGPRLDALRAPLDNDNWAYQQWFENGLHKMVHRAQSATVYQRADGAYVLSYDVISQAPNGAKIRGGSSGSYTIHEDYKRPFLQDDFKFSSSYVWTIYADGSIELESGITSNKPSLVLPHIGFKMEISDAYPNYTYYGRGPINNYVDRKTGQFIQRYESSVLDQFVRWPNPQSTGNREEVRWSALTDDAGAGVIFVAKDAFSVSALPWSELDFTLAPHSYQLPASTSTHLYLLDQVTGLGGNSCGQGPPLEQDRVKADAHNFGFIIRPVRNNNAGTQAKVSAAGDMPILITRDKMGEVKVSSKMQKSEIWVQVNDDNSQVYSKPIKLREGGIVKAWYTGNKELVSKMEFAKMESIPTHVVYASSQETGEGNAEHLTDGDPRTIWHTVYSVTVAQYPHWVDFDAGEEKVIKGFTFLPRQDGRNGYIKGYRVQLSADGKNWSQSIAEGEFDDTAALKTILFTKPEKARYIRFTALSSQHDQDFASGAEFVVLAE